MLAGMTVDNPAPKDGGVARWGAAVLLGLLGELPGGSIAAAGLAEAIQGAQRARDLDWAAMTNARLSSLEAAGIRVDPNDPEFVALFTRLQRAASETADEEKRLILAQAAANSGSWSTVSYDVRSEYASVAADLLPVHIRVLVAMERAMEIDASSGDPMVPSADFPWVATEVGLSKVDARRIADYLEQRALGDAGGPGPATRPNLTEFGRGLLHYLRPPTMATGQDPAPER